jgi:TRAP-type C4-dicarboxylate transport system permease large subunit
MYLVLGTALDLIGQIALTMPVVFPAIVELGFDPIWFAVIIVKMMEMALITPPHGANVFVIGGIAPEVPMTRIFKGIIPFLLMDIVALIFLIIFPSISLLIPNLMF